MELARAVVRIKFQVQTPNSENAARDTSGVEECSQIELITVFSKT
jgi:hypothetical protein